MRRSATILLVALITLFGAAIRFYHLNAVSLRGDEAFTVLHWMREPLAQTLANIATVDPQGPLNYLLYRAYSLVVGSQEQIVRLLPALISVIGIPVMYALAARLFGRRGGLVAALLWVVHPFLIWHAQDARSYAIWSVTNPLALWLALRALRIGRRVDWLLFVFAAVLSLYTYYLELFTVAALNLYVFLTCWRRREVLLRWIAAEVAVVLLIAPWYLQGRLLSGGGYLGTASGFDVGKLFTSFVPTLIFGESYTVSIVVAWVLWAAFLIVGLLVLGRRWSVTPLLFSLFTVPLVGIAVVSSRLSVFSPRYVLSECVVVSLVLVGFWSGAGWRSFLGRFLVLVVVGLQVVSLWFYFNDYAKSPDWRQLSAYLQPRVESSDYLVQASADEAFTLYCLEYALSSDCDQKLPASRNQSPDEIDSVLTMRSTEGSSIWYVANPPPDWQNRTTALDWLDAHMQPVRHLDIAGLAVHQYMRWDVEEDEVGAPLATFVDVAQLLGMRSWREPNNTLLVWLYLQPLAQTPTSLKIFVHVINDAGSLAQDDQYPQDGRLSTTTWEPGVRLRDIYEIPLRDLPPGEVRFEVGFYDPDTSQRALLTDGTNTYSVPFNLPPPN